MSIFRSFALAVLGTVALGTPAIAQTATAISGSLPTSVIVHTMSGANISIPIDSKVASELVNDPAAKPLDASFVVFIANSKAYMVKDHMMPNGKMMVASILKDYIPAQGGG